MNKLVFCLLLVSVLSLDVVDNYDLVSYLGDWFEVASSPTVHDTFERNGYCTRARYGNNNDGTLSVYNKERKGSVKGEIKDIFGYAYIPDSKEPAKLKVDLDGAGEANYWIVRLGPVVNGKYDWAVVSEPTMYFMWVLARDPAKYVAVYEAEVHEIVTYELGFKGLFKKYVARDHTGCIPYDD